METFEIWHFSLTQYLTKPLSINKNIVHLFQRYFIRFYSTISTIRRSPKILSTRFSPAWSISTWLFNYSTLPLGSLESRFLFFFFCETISQSNFPFCHFTTWYAPFLPLESTTASKDDSFTRDNHSYKQSKVNTWWRSRIFFSSFLCSPTSQKS